MNDITELRGHLFGTLAALRDDKSPMDLERARHVADVAQTIINSAKVEVEYLKIVGGQGTGFLPAPVPGGKDASADSGTTVTPLAGGGRFISHRMK